MLTTKEVQELMSIIDKNHLTFLSKVVGGDYLTQEEKKLLQSSGIDYSKLYSPKYDFITQNLYFGLISDVLKNKAKQVTFNELRDSLLRGEYIPKTKYEKNTLHTLRTRLVGDMKTQRGKIFNDIHNIYTNKLQQQQFIQKEVEETLSGKSLREVANEISHKTGDWNRDFDRIVQYISHTSFDMGRALTYQQQYGEDSLVYKDVYPGGCKHCISLYLTKGIGSKPKVFKLSELINNGSNIGRKVGEWKPVVGSTHPYCRCTLNHLPPHSEWNEDKQMFETKYETKRKKKIKVMFNGKEYTV